MDCFQNCRIHCSEEKIRNKKIIKTKSMSQKLTYNIEEQS